MNENNKNETNENEFLFTCKECGSHDLYVECYYKTWKGAYWKIYVKRGSLNIEDISEHRVEDWEEDEEMDSGYEKSFEIDDENEDDEAEEIEIVEDTQEFYVRCEGCNREIEFGWSHPGWGGRIWPAECTDFNPWKCWPEPRYREKWAKKGWLRPVNDR